jgi:hypothetical protein
MRARTASFRRGRSRLPIASPQDTRIQADVTSAPHPPAPIDALDLDELRDDEILIRVITAGMCNTDTATRGPGLTASGTSGGKNSANASE